MAEEPRLQIIPIDIEEEMKASYIDYSMSVIVSRALPDVRDGLKPVQRRVLYSMKELDLAPNRSYKKSARIVGACLGQYHPHGDSAVYDAMVRMAQDFSMRAPLVDGQGNFGSVDGDSAAAMRYTEARMTRISQELLRDLDKETVENAQGMSDADRQEMIRGMVDRLASKLVENGKDLNGWLRLIRARTVLGERDKAAKALSEARSKFEGDSNALGLLNDFAAKLGLETK